MVIEVTCQGFKRERFATEDHLYGVDTVDFFGDAAPAIRRINKENFHSISA